MRVSDFDFELPIERIAQAPTSERDGARLYVLPRNGDAHSHSRIVELPSLLADRFPSGALLVVNDTRVIPARLRGRKESGGQVELLLVEPVGEAVSPSGEGWRETWLCLGGASKPLRAGMVVVLDGEDAPRARIQSVHGQQVTVEFEGEEAGGLLAAAARIGEVPLPPYIKRASGPSGGDAERYQTVYARVAGSVAAPTAGLHLSTVVLDELGKRGIECAPLTLHVGLGTFAPLNVPDETPLDEITTLHAERYEIPAATAHAIARARKAGKPIIAVGTTSVRALESAALVAAERESTSPESASFLVAAGAGVTRLFIRPGHRFRVVDGMLTNFHLPRSSLMMLVAALAGRQRLLAAYRDAIAANFRFYSYGDAMLIV